VDISDPTHPELLASYQASYEEYSKQVVIQNAIMKDNIAYVGLTTPDMIMEIVDLSNPSDPVYLSSYKPSNLGFTDIDMVLEDSLILFGSDIIDVSDPVNPCLVRQYRYSCTGMDVYNDKIYVARHNLFLVYDLSLLLDSTISYNPLYEGYHEWSVHTRSVIGRENDTIIFAATVDAGISEGGLLSINVSDPNNPKMIGKCDNPTNHYYRKLFIEEDILYSDKHIFDISDPSNMQIVGNFSIPIDYFDIADIFVHDDLAYLVVGEIYLPKSSDEGLFVYDVSDPAQPIFISQYITDFNGSGTNNVIVEDKIAYLTTTRGLHVINYSNPSAPQLLSLYGDSLSYQHIAISDTLAYLTTSRVFEIINISNPVHPVQIGFYKHYPSLGIIKEIAITGNYAYLTSFNTGLRVIDISNPFKPFYVETYRTPSTSTYDVFTHNSIFYLADYYGLMILSNDNYINFKCGDINSDGTIDITDAVYLINFIYSNGPTPDQIKTAETNCDNEINISDIVYLINYIYTNGNEPCDFNGDGFPDC